MNQRMGDMLQELAVMFDISQPRTWLIMVAVALVIGFICLKSGAQKA